MDEKAVLTLLFAILVASKKGLSGIANIMSALPTKYHLKSYGYINMTPSEITLKIEVTKTCGRIKNIFTTTDAVKSFAAQGITVVESKTIEQRVLTTFTIKCKTATSSNE